MMDPSNHSPVDGLLVVHQNGVHEEPFNSGKGVLSNDIDLDIAEIIDTDALNGKFENVVQLDNTATNDLSVGEIKEGPIDNMDSSDETISKEEKTNDQIKQSRASKVPVKQKNGNTPNPKGIHASGPRKSKDGKDEEALSAVSNGNLASKTHSRQPIKSKPFNEKQTQVSKHSGKSDAASSKAPLEKKTPKLLNKEPLDEVKGEAESSTTIAEDTKPRRVGTLPNYGFSFRCGERAERRKEFYSKLEEKIQAKELEESNLQAKTKETQEAEIKMLRKSLTFKATPMPSFYQEPPPPKVELKKIPTTRAKSPKLGRKKNSVNSESEGSTGSSGRQGRLSLDESHSKDTPVQQKKPQRKSLPPRLHAERTSSSTSKTASTSSKAMHHGKTSSSSVKNKDSTSSSVSMEEITEIAAGNEENSTFSSEIGEAPSYIEEPSAILSGKPGEAESHVNTDIVVEEQPQLSLVLEPIVAEH
ncbi:protein WVD2-like 5 [Neltuma alba]|uniref:protein WVD2-like 5 n=1 Tax=Neltuma alba TaxID=207710 RepID=UPI0010A54F1F|nr:protein WVD2-like 5 [Prosopis alba]XP_028779263.1 protein WVD2-like 5 [Prosopis alba]